VRHLDDYCQADLQLVRPRVLQSGRILDIGGGGEGVIGRLYGERVVAIDRQQSELLETQNEALKLVMDAREMSFVPGSFDVITCFFTLMYLPRAERLGVLQEARRVLKPGGAMLLWDAEIPLWADGQAEAYVVSLQVELSEASIRTDYGVRWQGHEQSLSDCLMLAESAGFEVKEANRHGSVFSCSLQKPL